MNEQPRCAKGLQSSPAYPGESVNLHGTRVTAEFAYGLTKTVELGLYPTVVRDQTGSTTLEHVKFRGKWLPIQPEEAANGKVGMFAGYRGAPEFALNLRTMKAVTSVTVVFLRSGSG